MKNSTITVITPTTGKESLHLLIKSINEQSTSVAIKHILLWDDFREGPFIEDNKTDKYSLTNIIIDGSTVEGMAKGSALRSIGLMAAQTEWVTFADDDIMWEPNHVESMLAAVDSCNWIFAKRRIWTRDQQGEYVFLGVDNFESVGEEAKTPYKMVDNNCMMFKRRLGTSAAVLYRETREYNDDRLMYAFLKQYAGEPAKTNLATVNQVCPTHLVEFFKQNCSPE